MKFTFALVASVLALSVSAAPLESETLVARAVATNLVPAFGVKAGVNPTGTGDCEGINKVKIPCSCPPNRAAFIKSLSANVAAGHAVKNPSIKVSFPKDASKASKIARIQTAIITLQNLNGPGQGCPAASTTFSAQLKALTG
ncbi:hypothetical protein B0H16DRAFT_1318671 [Mycena metata]|uniref:Uncharacterized protein n=1 Tax=Mycena metata TaxID=1033252 RepID=A0AAD7ITP4_9AGAR|nr:hypothetical protein B0H16DRAFT_1318671 [Mycena metata]